MADGLLIRPAGDGDVARIAGLVSACAARGQLLPRTPEDIRARLGDFLVAERDGVFTGCCALRGFGRHLYEVRSLAVAEEARGGGLGSALVRAAVKTAAAFPGARVFALTRRPSLFMACGFKVVDKTMFPEKIWHDCDQCPKRDRCDETALITEP
jgi:amino-acid N-acetyltransferase